MGTRKKWLEMTLSPKTKKKWHLKLKTTLNAFHNTNMNVRRNRLLLVLLLLVIVMVINFIFGVWKYMMANNYNEFHYPLHVNIKGLLGNLKKGITSKVKPLNTFDFKANIDNVEKCINVQSQMYLQIRILFIVKSAIDNFKLRMAIRKTWGNEHRFSDAPVRTVFILGRRSPGSYTQRKVELENEMYRDIIQGDFHDDYYNNTLKVMFSLKWAYDNCRGVNAFAFIDDDYYVSTKKLLRYLRNPFQEDVVNPNPYKIFRNKRFFGGYVFPSSIPQRFRFGKWYISLDDYPFARWPPYITGGAFVLSYLALEDMIYTSYYTKLVNFDDIFLGILAKRANITLTHIEDFRFWETKLTQTDYNRVIASHGFSDPDKLVLVWNSQKHLGNT